MKKVLQNSTSSGHRTLLALAFALSGILPACEAQDDDWESMWMPRGPATAPLAGAVYTSASTPYALSEQSASGYERSQDAYVIAIAVSCACAGLILLAIGGIAATLDIRKFELHSAPAGDAGFQMQVNPGSLQRVEEVAATPVQREPYSPVMVVQPDESITIACKLGDSPEQPKTTGSPVQRQAPQRAHSAALTTVQDRQNEMELGRAGSSPT